MADGNVTLVDGSPKIGLMTVHDPKTQQEAIIHTDGSCSANGRGRRGGWAFVLRIGLDVIERCGSATSSTSNRMELQAVIEALKLLREYGQSYDVEIVSDSRYVIDGVSNWMHKWAKKGWITSTKTVVANKDLWVELFELAQPHKITCSWVESHAGDPDNERADQLANQMAGCNRRVEYGPIEIAYDRLMQKLLQSASESHQGER
jgi:ribonuclease HI